MNEYSCKAAKSCDIMRAHQNSAAQQDFQASKDSAIIVLAIVEDYDILWRTFFK
jgi:hypothetical protein